MFILNMHSINEVDLNLLSVFRAMNEERHVTRAAKSLGITQPALSHALNRLRETLGDPLFVKSSQGMVATPRAEALARPIAEALALLERELFGAVDFSPQTLKRTFRVRTTDLVESCLLPGLLRQLEAEAPEVKVVTTALNFELPKESLESGQCDLAIAGFFGELPGGFYQQKLFVDPFLCAVRKKHPRLGKKKSVSLGNYCDERHILIAPGGELRGTVDRVLGSKKRTLVAGLSNFMVSGWVLAESDAVLTAPSRTIALIAKAFPLHTFEPPLRLTPISVVQVWHQRNHEDAAHRWFRDQIRKNLQSAVPLV